MLTRAIFFTRGELQDMLDGKPVEKETSHTYRIRCMIEPEISEDTVVYPLEIPHKECQNCEGENALSGHVEMWDGKCPDCGKILNESEWVASQYDQGIEAWQPDPDDNADLERKEKEE